MFNRVILQKILGVGIFTLNDRRLNSQILRIYGFNVHENKIPGV